MEHLKKMVQEVMNGLDNGSGRFDIIDDVHIHDTQSGLKFHMYDIPTPFHITRFDTGEEIAHMRDFIKMPEILDMFTLLKEKLTKTYVSIAEAKRTKLLEIYNTPQE